MKIETAILGARAHLPRTYEAESGELRVANWSRAKWERVKLNGGVFLHSRRPRMAPSPLCTQSVRPGLR